MPLLTDMQGEIQPVRFAQRHSEIHSKDNYARVDAKELPALLRAIEVYRGTHVTRLAMKLMALTFVRTSELIGAKWVEFDLEAARWDIPAERMKMRTPHIVPLARQALKSCILCGFSLAQASGYFPETAT